MWTLRGAKRKKGEGAINREWKKSYPVPKRLKRKEKKKPEGRGKKADNMKPESQSDFLGECIKGRHISESLGDAGKQAFLQNGGYILPATKEKKKLSKGEGGTGNIVRWWNFEREKIWFKRALESGEA